jgi:hypothetical protein
MAQDRTERDEIANKLVKMGAAQRTRSARWGK